MVPEVFWAHGYCIRNLLNGLVFQEDPVEPVVIPEGSVSEPGLVAQGGKLPTIQKQVGAQMVLLA